MPAPKKTRLAQMLTHEQNKSGKTERELGLENGWSQQAFNTWKAGAIPRPKMYAALARFLKLTVAQVAELAEEAKASTGNTKLPDIGAPVKGKGTTGTVMMEKFASSFAAPSVAGCYAIQVDGKMMWINPRQKPVDGNTVLVRAGDVGKIMTWPNDFVTDGVSEDGIEQHVVVLAQLA